MSLFEIKCPMCKGTLWIDPATLKVVDHKSADHPKASLDNFYRHKKRESHGMTNSKKPKRRKPEEKPKLK